MPFSARHKTLLRQSSMFARPSSPCGHSLFFPKFILRSALSEHGVCISKIISDNTSYEQEEEMESKRGQELRNERIKEKSVRGRERGGEERDNYFDVHRT